MNWLINEVTEIAGVTSRTLRHYDRIGILKPRETTVSGRRVYGYAELRRLQRIRLLRELDLPLKVIAQILDSDDEGDEMDALSEHLDWLRQERRRLGRLAATVQNTIDTIRKGEEMEAKQLFDGFDPSEYEAEARERWGDEKVDESHAAAANLSEEDWSALKEEQAAVSTGLAKCLKEGRDVSDPEVQQLVERHYRTVAVFWTPDAAGYTALGEMYVADPRFAANYEPFGEGLTDYLRDGMAEYARTNLR